MSHPEVLDSLLHEERVFRPLPQMIIEAGINPQDLRAARDRADSDLCAYWEEAAEELDWFTKWDQVLDDSKAPDYKWFTGARCNIVYNALDRHIETVNKNRLALIWEGEPGDSRQFTYYELYRAVNRFANGLRALGVTKGDRVVLYMPQLPETVISMLACARIGAVHSLVFSGFSAKHLRERIREIQPRVVVTVDGFYRNGQVIRLKEAVDHALLDSPAEKLESVVVVHRANVEVEMDSARDYWYEDIVRHERAHASSEIMDSNDPLFILHTSGTAGKPKGIIHSHGGYMVGVHRTFKWVFDLKPTDIFWCSADPGWITGHSYLVYGPLLAGTTTVMYEGHALYPQADRLWNIISKYGVSIFYTSPTQIRTLMRFGHRYPDQHDLSTLRILGAVGEPFNPEAWIWFYENIGKSQCPVLDTWWQTETGMIMISPMPVSVLKPGSVTRALPGIDADVVDLEGNSVPAGKGGFLVIKKPWPAMFSAVLNDDRALVDHYWGIIPGMFYAGDVARKDEDGYFWIQGRADDVLNISGHRVGSAEVESALTSHPDVAEAVVIGVPDKIKGEVAKAFVTLIYDAMESDELHKELVDHIHRELGPIVVIKSIEFCDELPKTSSGKIKRLTLKEREDS
ncbi:acetyl-CoA synthetase [Maridesulfovibrio ferrireducens]|uniref:Acetate--CoA ligase n=1 Tax=Maridesulfovibrio ferrireducens TaxID=246191 RepID=A0A1G9BU65_9BACT|nr:acetate--CoA ligase [Maridesulfovibrio ferrireducens]SDK42933.1 acetyl-CoA synthetase [Maridesulfovibrio ferrireducens]